jgi:hypothetical protein
MAVQIVAITLFVAVLPIALLGFVFIGVLVAALIDAPGEVVVVFAAYAPIVLALLPMLWPARALGRLIGIMPRTGKRPASLRRVLPGIRRLGYRLRHLGQPSPMEIDAAIDTGLAHFGHDATLLHGWLLREVDRFAVIGDTRCRRLAIALARRLGARMRRDCRPIDAYRTDTVSDP